MENSNEPSKATKSRHGCVTSLLILIIIGSSLTVFTFLFSVDTYNQYVPQGISTTARILLIILGLLNVIFAIALLKWKKWAFWGFAFTTIAELIIDLSMGLGVIKSIIGLLGIIILYAVLQIKKDNLSGWNNLE